MDKLFDYKVNKICLWERFLLLFKRPTYVVDSDGHIKCRIGYKHLFGKTYIVSEDISVRKQRRLNNERTN